MKIRPHSQHAPGLLYKSFHALLFNFTTRKICKTCKCKPEEHDVKGAEEEASFYHVVRSLFSKDSSVGQIRDYFHKLEAASNTPRSEYAKQFAWCPLGLEQRLVSYFRLCNREDLKGDVSILNEQTTQNSTDATKLPYFAFLLFVLKLTDIRD